MGFISSYSTVSIINLLTAGTYICSKHTMSILTPRIYCTLACQSKTAIITRRNMYYLRVSSFAKIACDIKVCKCSVFVKYILLCEHNLYRKIGIYISIITKLTATICSPRPNCSVFAQRKRMVTSR